MALVETTLSAAVTAQANKITVASATSIAAGRLIRIDNEVMQVTKGYVAASTSVPVARGVQGSVQGAHPVTARVVHGAAGDFSKPGIGQNCTWPLQGTTRNMKSYSASGAISLPAPGSDEVAVLNSTNALTMTLVAPTLELDGSVLYIVANGAAAHTVTVALGFGLGGGGYTVATFDTTGHAGLMLMACNSVWVVLNQIDGTLTNIATSIA
jgi:hypothetical protein